MSPHTARAYQGDLRQFTGWLAAQQIPPNKVTPGVTMAWLAQLEEVNCDRIFQDKISSRIKDWIRTPHPARSRASNQSAES